MKISFFSASRMAVMAAHLFSFAPANAPAQPAKVVFQSSENKTSLLELYTSEGCSSCPPAEAWLSRQKDADGLWKEFVPVAFHVDYWDDLGWRDRWATKLFSDRQRAHARAWGSGNIYTPEFVLNGQEWRGWTGRKPVTRSETKAGVLTVSLMESNRWQVSFAPAISGGSYEVHAALLACGLSSDVKAGENSGRRLTHDFVVLTLVNERLEQRDKMFQGAFTVAPNRKPSGGRPALSVWVTRTGQLESLQATGGWWPPAN
jgi:hypothetical protein